MIIKCCAAKKIIQLRSVTKNLSKHLSMYIKFLICFPKDIYAP